MGVVVDGEPRWVYPFGTAERDRWQVDIGPHLPGWRHTGLRVADLSAGESIGFELADREAVVVPLRGGATLEITDAAGPGRVVLAGRPDVFAGPTDVAYLPAGAGLRITAADTGARIAVCTAQTAAGAALPVTHLPAARVPVELRGAGHCSRAVRNFGVPGVLAARSIIACEVITPAGNISSYPPHKHDVHRPGLESELEEIYYFEVRAEPGAPAQADPHGYQRVYGTGERPIQVMAQVRGGDVVLVPYGWHGPAIAMPGYDLYYLNVMAGPGPERAWLICDDPAHGWVREGWPHQAVDPRLGMGGLR